MNQLLISVLNAVLYLFAFLYFYNKKRNMNTGVMIILFYTISNFVSVYYFSFDDVSRKYKNITIFPYLYLFLSILVCVYPFVKLKHDNIKVITARGSENFIYLLSILIFVFSVEPFIENILLLLRADTVSLGEIYIARNEGDPLEPYTPVGRRLNYISNLFSTTNVVFLFYHISRKTKISKTMVFGYSIVIINTIISCFNTANRAGILSQVFFILSCYLLFKNSLKADVLSKIRIIGLTLICAILCLTITITVARYNYGDSSNSMFSWIALYGGEGPLNFNNDLWYINFHTNGDDLFCFLKDLLGFDTFTDYSSRNNFYYKKNGVFVEIFFTFIGDIFYDFGLLGTPVFCCVIFLILNRLIKSRYVFSLEIIFLLILFSHIFFMGFSAYIHRAYSAQFALIFPLFVIFVLYLNRVTSSRSI